MFNPRVIPVLLLKDLGLVKSKAFKDFRYIGDPINAVKLFNNLRVHELVFLDISATANKMVIPIEIIKSIGQEANMPFSVGGGIRTLNDIYNIIRAGAEKVIIGTYAFENPDFIKQASNEFGSSTIVVCVDVKTDFFKKQKVRVFNGHKSTGYSSVDYAKLMEDKGAGEIIIQSIDKDGTMSGYDVDLIKEVSTAVTIPIIALGGAGKVEHLKDAYNKGYASALAAGSMFVYHGSKNGVLINYPEKSELKFNRE